MKVIWKKAKIGEVCSLMTGGTPSRNNPEFFGGDIRWLVSGDIHQREIFECEGRITELGLKNSNARMLPVNSVMIALNGQGKTRGTVALLRIAATCNQSLVSITPKDEKKLLPEFLYANLYWRYQEIRRMTGDKGNDRRGLNMPLIRGIEIPIPSLPEQQHIVTKLDEAATHIATARANVKQNFQNARAIFESHLQAVFNQKGEGWVETTVGKLVRDGVIAKPQDGNHGEIHPTKADYVETGIPFVMAADLINGSVDTKGGRFISEKRARSLRIGFSIDQDVLLSHKGTIGRVAILETDQEFVMLTPQVTYYRVVDKAAILNRYLYFYFLCPQFQNQIGHIAGAGSTRAYIGITRQLDLKILLPPLDVQHKIAAQLKALQDESRRLEGLYQRKLEALDELNQSLLHQAFSGELTKNFRSATVIPFPIHLADIEVPDLHAGLLAMAYALHEKHGKQRYFGHVKAEKTAHMIESHLGINLERTPIKDAAGPNDFQRLQDVEKHARKAGYFSFDPVDKRRYRVMKLEKFEALVERTRTALGSRLVEVEALLEIMVPMRTRSAEIFCTVYAAWNNMLLENRPISDEEIVREARENWHTDKLKLRRERFFSAIEWIRNKGLSPQGRGKMVLAKAK